MAAMTESTSFSKVACVGAGISGICVGASLQRWYGETDVQIFERSKDPCGTWNINRYPGCGCDVPSALYSFSFEQNPHWSRLLPSNTEMEEYLLGVVTKYQLRSQMQLRCEVIECEWLEDRKRWRLQIQQLDEKRHFVHECCVLFSAVGQLVYPQDLDVSGVGNFNGHIFHSARWRTDVDLKNKNVVVFGNGCTAAQIVPAIMGEAKSVTQIVRAKHWIFPTKNAEYTALARWMFRYVPLSLRLYRLLIFISAERGFSLFPNSAAAAKLRAKKRVKVERYMRQTAPQKYHDLLIPNFEVGCKRRIFDPGYLKSLHSEKVSLTNARPVRITAGGVETESGFIKADVIVAATGFKTNEFISPMVLRGRSGRTLSEHWEDIGGPEAYNCSVVNGFPNFFMLLGPNSATGHTSAIMAIENSVEYALRILRPVFQSRASVVEIKRDAELQYSRTMQERLSRTVWNTGCTSWYVKRDNDSGFTWNSMSYPRSQSHFWWRSFFPIWKDWNIDAKSSGLEWHLYPSMVFCAICAILSGVFLGVDLFGMF